MFKRIISVIVVFTLLSTEILSINKEQILVDVPEIDYIKLHRVTKGSIDEQNFTQLNSDDKERVRINPDQLDEGIYTFDNRDFCDLRYYLILVNDNLPSGFVQLNCKKHDKDDGMLSFTVQFYPTEDEEVLPEIHLIDTNYIYKAETASSIEFNIPVEAADKNQKRVLNFVAKNDDTPLASYEIAVTTLSNSVYFNKFVLREIYPQGYKPRKAVKFEVARPVSLPIRTTAPQAEASTSVPTTPPRPSLLASEIAKQADKRNKRKAEQTSGSNPLSSPKPKKLRTPPKQAPKKVPGTATMPQGFSAVNSELATKLAARKKK